MNEDLLPDGGPAHPKKQRNRAAYNRALKEARSAYWAKAAEDPEFVASTSWDVFRNRQIKQAMDAEPSPARGRPRSTNPTPRQEYQRVYQKARRDAEAYYHKSTKLRSQFDGFAAYWTAHKSTWLPDGFIRRRGRPLTAKRDTNAKDRRTAYRVVYNHHTRCWEGNIADCRERFGTWARYWEYVKANGFVPGLDEQVPIEHTVTYDDGDSRSPLNGGQWFDYIPAPEGSRVLAASPITRPALQEPMPMPTRVLLDTDTIEANDGWFNAA
jgi:hypothetical protein